MIIIIIAFQLVPGAPSSVEIKVENSTAVSITWMKPEKPNGYIFGVSSRLLRFQTECKVLFTDNFHTKPLLHLHYIQVKMSSEISVIDGPHTVTLKNETNTFVVISGLQSGLTYEFLVRIFCTDLNIEIRSGGIVCVVNI